MSAIEQVIQLLRDAMDSRARIEHDDEHGSRSLEGAYRVAEQNAMVLLQSLEHVRESGGLV